MDKIMAGNLTYVKGCIVGCVTTATILFLIDGCGFTSHDQLTPTFSSQALFEGDNTKGGRENDIYSDGTSLEDRPKMILATTNSGFLDFTRNWLASMSRSGIKHPIVIIAEDMKSFETLGRSDYPGLHVNISIGMESKSHAADGVLKFSSDKYLQFVNKRPTYILDYLTQGFDVLFSDVDIVLFEDPFPYFDIDVDINLQIDIWKRDNHNHSDVFCAGFVFYRATEATRDFLQKLMLRITLEPKVPDQILLNRLLREKVVKNSLRTRAMDGNLFVSGRYYFNQTWRALHTTRQHPVMVHNNWIKRTSDKLKRFKDLGLWYL